MIELQGDHNRYYKQQFDTTVEFIIPFIEREKKIEKGMRFLEVGSGYGGICKAFADAGCRVTGIELLDHASQIAKDFLQEEIKTGQVSIINKNVYDIDPEKDLDEKYDIILLKDTIEHIHGQDKFVKHIINFLKPNGVIFFAFPPWFMPFGGHQQSLDSKFLDKLPYFHILPTPIYRGIMKLFGEIDGRIVDVLEVKETQISINRFERITKEAGFAIAQREFYLINPSYKYKFGANPKKQYGFISALPWIRDFVTTTCYYVLKKK
ncbi:MAG: class I SAM-dependent methyltransferase [Bacteroidia bacterium]|nr:class I SAM-dependent methyltransferase [Bacteroidia bacterium]MCF8427333.1 class I SAM-dependent methyltransferase [Bacteroidia bacterium]MCF8448117.1 class I SAM-dependent methyltransferase [Bacteroidia bacterium]